MTPKISLVAAAGIAALALTGSSAFAQSSTPKSGPSDFGPAVSTQGSIPYAVPGDGFYRPVRAKSTNQGSIPYAVPGDGFYRAVRAKSTHQANVSSDSGERAAAAVGTAYAASVSSDSRIEWPQIGLGFGAGIVLALGFVLSLRHIRIRPLAH